MSEAKDNPGIIAPPPLIALAALVLGLVLSWFVPLYMLETVLSSWTRGFVGGVVATAGLALGLAGRSRFIEAGTNVNPWKPSVNLATAGVFQYVRNPMYVGLLMMVGGFGIAFASEWTLLLLLPTAFLFRNGVVLREERYLEGKFGEPYLRYKAGVPRWGIW